MKGLLNISQAASLALHGLVLIAQAAPARLNARDLADRLEASEAHLAKVLRKLQRAGLLDSLRGPAGGFSLTEKAGEYSLLEIYELIDGLGEELACPLGEAKCNFKECIFQNSLNPLLKKVREAIDSIRLADFINRRKGGEYGRL